jgi:colanic acid/amylovoran biosynthesis glycosyltransferase
VAARLRGRPPGAWRWQPTRSELDALDRSLAAAEVEVVLIEYLDVWLSVVPWLVRRGLRVFGHAHGYDVSVRLGEPWWREQYRAYDSATGVITVSEHARRRLVDIGLDEAQVSVIPCGVDVPGAVPHRAPREEVVVAAVGRMVAKKHPLATIEAFRRASVEVDGLRLVMLGDGPLLEDARVAVRAAGLEDRVELLGARPHRDVVDLLARADVFAQHSVVSPTNGDEEGLPVGVLEAMASGLPVVSTRHAGIPEAVEEGVTGLLVQEGDVDAMAAALVELGRDPQRRVTLGLAGHARAAARFSWAREQRDLRALLRLGDG